MSTEDIFQLLDFDIDERLFQLEKKQLLKLLNKLADGKSKRDLANLISNNNNFSLDEIMRSLEKTEKKLLNQLLREPETEKDMRTPIRNLFRDSEYTTKYEIPYPKAGRNRYIDVVGFKEGGWLSSGKIICVECKSKTSRASIDQAFGQAQDYLQCSDATYVAFTPYALYKQYQVIQDKLDDNELIGLLLVDKGNARVIKESKESSHDDELWESIKQHF